MWPVSWLEVFLLNYNPGLEPMLRVKDSLNKLYQSFGPLVGLRDFWLLFLLLKMSWKLAQNDRHIFGKIFSRSILLPISTPTQACFIVSIGSHWHGTQLFFHGSLNIYVINPNIVMCMHTISSTCEWRGYIYEKLI